MSHTVCTDVGQWVESTIQQQAEQCLDQGCVWSCLCCNRLLCGLAWVFVNVMSWMVTTVCEVVADAIDLTLNVARGMIDTVVGIFTGDWSRIVAGFGEILGGVLAFVAQIVSIVTLGTLVATFTDSLNAWRLRDYARDRLRDKYGTDPRLGAMLDALGINSGGFGLRLNVTGLRTFVRSDFSSRNDGVPDLFVWIRDNGIDLRSLAGFDPPAWWSRNWPELVGDQGPISESDIGDYISNGGMGPNVRHFSLFSMSTGDMQSRLDCAQQHASEIGLVLHTSIVDTRVASPDQVIVDHNVFAAMLAEPPFSRHSSLVSASMATTELCQPIAIGVFGFTDSGTLGISGHLADCNCLEAGSHGRFDFPPEKITGAAFRYHKPDLVFKYTAIHELGHTFGLCHVDNVLRIMFTNAAIEQRSMFTWGTLSRWWTHGTEASFILDEGKKVWDYIVANFGAECLATRRF